MPEEAPTERVSGGPAPSDEGKPGTWDRPAPGPPAAVCPECGVVVRFMDGYDPAPISWAGNICPACRRERLFRMSEEEQKRAILVEIHRDPTAPASALAQRTGLGKGLARRVRQEAVREGIAEPLAWTGKPKPPPKSARVAKVEVGTDEARAAVTDNPGVGAGDVADKVGVPRTTARRYLKLLVESGEVRTTKEGRNVRYWPVESGSKAG